MKRNIQQRNLKEDEETSFDQSVSDITYKRFRSLVMRIFTNIVHIPQIDERKSVVHTQERSIDFLVSSD